MCHKDTLAVLAERTDHPLENLKASSRQIVIMYLTKTIHYSRAIIENTNSRNLLVAFQSMRALVEGVATVRYTIEKIRPIVHLCSTGGTVTAEEARQLDCRPRSLGSISSVIWLKCHRVPHWFDNALISRHISAS